MHHASLAREREAKNEATNQPSRNEMDAVREATKTLRTTNSNLSPYLFIHRKSTTQLLFRARVTLPKGTAAKHIPGPEPKHVALCNVVDARNGRADSRTVYAEEVREKTLSSYPTGTLTPPTYVRTYGTT